jgi:Tol biopolymer transport system component/serine/threonine protein kinase
LGNVNCEMAAEKTKHFLSEAQQIAYYRIIKPIGAGGMGEVYLAEDMRLGRRLALKILPAALIDKAESVRRFEQEARAASALNHPNIVTIYEISANDHFQYIAEEFVDGVTLRQHAHRVRYDLREALDIALQVAAALNAAHEAGIVHRDIKPENIMLRRDGLVKVLDFGLAKLIDATPVQDVDLEASTEFDLFTTPGALLGTTPYMSPEQARGLEVDARSDIFSFGSVLYEMLTGVMPFRGETKADTLIAVVQNEPPPLAHYAPDVPNELQRIVSKALRKDRNERYQTIKDLLLDLKSLKEELHWQRLAQSKGQLTSDKGAAISTDDAMSDVPTKGAAAETSAISEAPSQLKTFSPARVASSKSALVFLAALIAIGAAALFITWRWNRNAAKRSEANLPLATMPVASWKSSFNEFIGERGRFSPDGKFVAYASTKDGRLNIWVKQLAGGDPSIVTGTGNDWRDYSPVWSPDGQQLAFLSDRGDQFGVWTIPFLGGTPVFVKEAPPGSHLISWAKSGATIFYQANDNLFALDLKAKQTAQLTQFDSSQRLNRRFAVSPDEETIAYDDMKDAARDIWTMPLHGGAPTRITRDGANNRNPVWMPDGARIIYNSTRNGVAQICVVDVNTRASTQITFSDTDNDVSDVSPDGTRILYANSRDEADLWGVRLDSIKGFQLTSDVGIELWADAAPDGRHFVYQAKPLHHASVQIFDCALYVASLAGDERRLPVAENGFYPQWSPDGKRIAFLRFEKDSAPNLFDMQAAGGEVKRLTREGIDFAGFSRLPYNRLQTRDYEWSPDSQLLAYCATRNGVSNVWTAAVDGAGEKQFSHNAERGTQCFNPLWSPDGKRIAYLARKIAADGAREVRWEIYIDDGSEGRKLYESDSVLGLLGWDSAGDSLLVKTIEGKRDPVSAVSPNDVLCLKISVAGGKAQPFAQLSAAYFNTLQIAPDGSRVAFVRRENKTDELCLISADGGESRKIVNAGDPRVYLFGLSWSQDGKTIYYGKQTSWHTLFILDNFK